MQGLICIFIAPENHSFQGYGVCYSKLKQGGCMNCRRDKDSRFLVILKDRLLNMIDGVTM